jgi:hypothetical protein
VRIAAGILMTIVGMALLGTFVAVMADYGIHAYDLAFNLFIIISTLFLITGGVFCLKTKYWKACFASALLLFALLIFWSLSLPPGLSWLTWFFIPGGILPIVFISLTKKEWQRS